MVYLLLVVLTAFLALMMFVNINAFLHWKGMKKSPRPAFILVASVLASAILVFGTLYLLGYTA